MPELAQTINPREAFRYKSVRVRMDFMRINAAEVLVEILTDA
jgi:hypothetical protein